jgi:hypothetical protein
MILAYTQCSAGSKKISKDWFMERKKLQRKQKKVHSLVFGQCICDFVLTHFVKGAEYVKEKAEEGAQYLKGPFSFFDLKAQ